MSTLAAGLSAASFLIISSTMCMASNTEISSVANSLVYLEASLVKISLCRTRSLSLALLKLADFAFAFAFACAIFQPPKIETRTYHGCARMCANGFPQILDTSYPDVGYVDQRVFMPVAVKDFAARAPHQGTRFLRRHLFASLPHGIFASGPILLIAPRLKIDFRPVRQ
jgi:hypothetical protein